MRKKKVVILHNILSPHIVPLFERLAKEKEFDFKFFFASESEANRLWKTEVGKKFNYKILPKIAIEFRKKDLFTYFINPTIIFELIRYNPDVIIVGGWDIFAYQIAFLYAKLFRKKFILRSGSTKYEKSWRRTVSKPLVWLITKSADACIAYGTRAKEYLIFLGAKPEKIFIAYNTIDIDFFRKEVEKWRKQTPEIKRQRGVKTKRVILYVGQLIKRKGIDYLIKAFGKVKNEFRDVSLLIVGYGQQENELKELVKKEKIKDVFFVGGVDWKETPKFYAIADLFVLPSLEEVWGLVINEAMAAGLAMITTDRVGASVDLVKGRGNGYVVKSSDVQELHWAIKKILGNPKLLAKMREKSLDLIKDFGIGNQEVGVFAAINYVNKK